MRESMLLICTFGFLMASENQYLRGTPDKLRQSSHWCGYGN